MSSLGEAGGTVQSVFRSADLPFPEVTLANGEKVRLDASAYTKYRASPNKADRDLVVQGVLDRPTTITRARSRRR